MAACPPYFFSSLLDVAAPPERSIQWVGGVLRVAVQDEAFG